MEQLREQIVGALAMIEALIDFGEGEEIEEGVYAGGPGFLAMSTPTTLTPFQLVNASSNSVKISLCIYKMVAGEKSCVLVSKYRYLVPPMRGRVLY